MTSEFWQLGIADVVKGAFLLTGMMGSAWVFTWKMGKMHGENIQKIDGLTTAISATGEIQREHTEELAHLKSLADSSQERLRLIEQEMRDNRNKQPPWYEAERTNPPRKASR